MDRSPAQSFQDLMVWQKAHTLVLNVYRISEAFPKAEMYGLTSQLRRASVSIAANIAEGFKKRGLKDKARFMNIAEGSLEECQYYLILVQDLGYSNTDALKIDLEEVGKMLGSYRRKILTNQAGKF